MQSSYSRALAIVAQPWLAAKLMFKPKVRPTREDRILDRLAFWRATVGLATIVVISYPYQGLLVTSVSSFSKMWDTVALALLLPPLSLLLMLVITPSRYRAQLLPGVRRLLVHAGSALAVICLSFFLLFLLGIGIDTTSDAEGAGILVLVLALPFVLLWYCCFWGCVVYWAARTGMWTGEIHPLLAPIGSTLIMLLLNVRELIASDSNGLPYGIWLTLNLCGTATSLGLSFAEFRRLRALGYRFRSGPEPVTLGAAEPVPHGEREPAN